jgi:8-oxo-dGTP diphosphatase
MHCTRGHWASCSGSIELEDTSPIHRAWTELREEIGFSENELTLIRSGDPQVIVDEMVDTRWTVYPFLFQLKSPEFEEKMQIDWEHTEFKWIDPRDLSTYRTVPSLVETLHKVLHDVDGSMVVYDREEGT